MESREVMDLIEPEDCNRTATQLFMVVDMINVR